MATGRREADEPSEGRRTERAQVEGDCTLARQERESLGRPMRQREPTVSLERRSRRGKACTRRCVRYRYHCMVDILFGKLS